jgi:hypothetical protein
MGQNRQSYDSLSEHESQDLRDAGYMDTPKEESYLPSSVHGSPRHMAALARNALILVSEFGCPHVFITLTCNPKWPEIVSQLLHGQTAFDRSKRAAPATMPTSVPDGTKPKCWKKGGELRPQFLPTIAPYLLLFDLQVGARAGTNIGSL